MLKTGIRAAFGMAQTVVSERACLTVKAVVPAELSTDGEARVGSGETCASPYADSSARTMLQTYDWKGALESCREVLKHDPDHLGALEVSAQALWFAGEYEKVVLTTNRLLMLNPLEPGYRYTRGMALMSMGQLSRAADDFRQAIAQSDHPRFLLQVQSALAAIEEYQRGGVARTDVLRLVRRHAEFGGLSDVRVH